MGRLYFILCIIFLFPLISHASSPRLELLVKNMALSEDNGVKKLAAKIAYNEKISSVPVIDVFAYRLGTELNKNYDNDVISWYAKAVGEGGDKRYLAFLRTVESSTQDKKVKGYVNEAIKKLKNESSAKDFLLEDINIDTLHESINSEYSKNILKEKSFEGIDATKDIIYVIEKLGLPDSVEQELVTIRRPYVGSIITQRMILKYDGLGNVRLGYDGDSLLVERVHKSIAVPLVDGASKNAGLINTILTGTPMEYREIAKVIYRDKNISDDVLDAAARRIWADRELNDDFAIDGVAWLLKCIMQSANPRYKNFLESLDNKSTNSKIRKYAKKASNALLNIDVEQFVP